MSRSFFESHFNDRSRFDDDLLRVIESSVIRDKDRSRKSMSRQKEMFERFNQRKRFYFEQMKKNFNIDSIEAFKQMKQSLFKRRNRSFERERRKRREDNRDKTRDKTRDKARNDARNDVENDVKNDATDETNVFMKNVF